MKRYSKILLCLTILLVTLSASVSFASFPKADGNCVTLPMFTGWCDNNKVWYICTDTNNYQLACQKYLTYSKKLSSALKYQKAARPLYIITNGGVGNNAPVFSAAPPCDNKYSGLWRIIYVTFNCGVKPWTITNACPKSPCNTQGLPSECEATYCETDTVVDYPIVAVGSPRYPGGSKNCYMIPQAKYFNTCNNTISLPAFKVFCFQLKYWKICVAKVIITDAATCEIANCLKANYAPWLSTMPKSDTVDFYVFNWNQPGRYVPSGQFIIDSACPTSCDAGNDNIFYSPIADVTVFNRLTLPGSTIIDDCDSMDKAERYRQVKKFCDFYVNAPVVCCD